MEKCVWVKERRRGSVMAWW